MSKQTNHVGTISKLDLIKTASGHQPHATGTGAHRDKRKNPKGGRSATARRAIGEW